MTPISWPPHLVTLTVDFSLKLEIVTGADAYALTRRTHPLQAWYCVIKLGVPGRVDSGKIDEICSKNDRKREKSSHG